MNWWRTQLSCIYHVNAHDEHFLVRILRTYCCRLIQPVKMYVIWYMMWYLEKDMLCKEHIISKDSSFLKRSRRHPFFFWSVWPSSVIQRTRSTWNSFVHLCARQFLRSCTWSYFAIACTIVRTIFLVGPGFEPLALHGIFFVGPGFDSLALQHDLFVGPGFDSRTQLPVSGP